ncbi:MAG: ferrochelatase [Nitriliruptoraceae bacterium]
MSTTDAVLLVSFGGPEGPDDVMPFLERVVEGRNVPRERLEEVAEHYLANGGRSPLNDQNRALRTAIEALFAAEGPDLRVYWGNRNWDPLLVDTLREMRDDGVERALCFVTSAYSSYSGCRQYREDLAAAATEIGDGVPELLKLRVYHNHPGFVEPNVDAVVAALDELEPSVRDDARIVFVTHSIPRTMARHSDYEAQHLETCRLVMDRVGSRPWDLVYCSRSGPPQVPWLEPDVNDHLAQVAGEGVRAVVLVPIGFVSDHMEVIHDLDVEARETAEEHDLAFIRAATAGTDPRFVALVRDLVVERIDGGPRTCLGLRGPGHDLCPVDCCRTPDQPVHATISEAPAPRRPA